MSAQAQPEGDSTNTPAPLPDGSYEVYPTETTRVTLYPAFLTPNITFRSSDKDVIRLDCSTGNITLGEGVTLDQASKTFYELVVQNVVREPLKQQVAQLERENSQYKVSSTCLLEYLTRLPEFSSSAFVSKMKDTPVKPTAIYVAWLVNNLRSRLHAGELAVSRIWEAISSKYGDNAEKYFSEENWDLDAHVEVTLTIRDIRTLIQSRTLTAKSTT